jgi:putative proteasome-type protease
MPLDLAVIGRDALRVTENRRIEDRDEDFREMSAAWSAALRQAFQSIQI